MRTSIFRIQTKVSYKLTILIPTLYTRIDKLKSLLTELNYQIQSKPVQLLWIGDNKSMTIGEKRNLLKSMAKGEWMCYIDDDDEISINYIDTILNAIDENQDKTVICFRGEQTTDNAQDAPFRYDINFGMNFKKQIDGVRWKVMIPDHLCVWRRSQVAKDFPLKNISEDHDWAKAMTMTYTDKDQVLLEDTLYYYHYNRHTTECRR